MSITLDEYHLYMSALGNRASENMPHLFITSDSSHSSLNVDASINMDFIAIKSDQFHFEKFPLHAEALRNLSFMLVRLKTSHFES